MPFPFQLRRSSNLFSPRQMQQPQPYSNDQEYDDNYVPESSPYEGIGAAPKVKERMNSLDFGAEDALSRNQASVAPSSSISNRRRLDPNDLNPRPSPMTDRYSEMLSKGAPQDSRPAWNTILGAGIAGVGQGPQAANAILSRDYQRKRDRYQMDRDALGDASTLERLKEAERIRSVKDQFGVQNDIEDNDRADAAGQRASLTDSMRIKNWQSMIDQRKADAETQGWHFTTDKVTGHSIGHKMNPNSPQGFDTMDLGKVDQSLDEESARKVSDSASIGAKTLERQKNLGTFNFGLRETGAKNDAARNIATHETNATADQNRRFDRDDRQWDLGEVRAVNNQKRTQENGAAAETRRSNRPQTPQQQFQNRALTARKLIESKVVEAKEFDLDKGMALTDTAKQYLDAVTSGSAIMKAPDGSTRIVPKDKIAEALKNGGRMVVQ